jgi:hypothetical protein
MTFDLRSSVTSGPRSASDCQGARWRKTFLRHHVARQLERLTEDVLALTSLRQRMNDLFPLAFQRKHGRASSNQDEIWIDEWLRRGPLSLRGRRPRVTRKSGCDCVQADSSFRFRPVQFFGLA